MIRRAMSKKKHKVIDAERVAFVHGDESRGIDGAVKRGIIEDIANSIYDEILDFASYAFNKAHAAAYAVVAYQTAYFKCHYPKEYMAALLSSVLDSSDKVGEYFNECRECGIKLLPPDVNHSADRFTVEPEGIRFGLVAIKNIGRGLIARLMRERERATHTAADIHEADDAYLRECRENARGVAARCGWQRVDCTRDGRMRGIEDIHEEVYARVKALLG